MIDRRHLALWIALGLPSLCLAQEAPPQSRRAAGVPWTKIPSVVVLSRRNDRRHQDVLDAIDFWNGTLAELGTAFKFGAVARKESGIPSEIVRAIGSGVLAGGGTPTLPDIASATPQDIIVLLTDDDIISFAARWPSVEKALVAIRSDQIPPLTLPNVTRNVIAHELGHAIGLGHNADAAMLMCGRPAPCRPNAFASSQGRFFPLSDVEKAALVAMYPAHWRSR